MSKGYWIAYYRSVSDEATLANYAKLAERAILAHGGVFLVRGKPAKTYEAGLKQRLVVIEFESVERAIETYESREYQAALKILANCAERDVRIMEGVEPIA